MSVAVEALGWVILAVEIILILALLRAIWVHGLIKVYKTIIKYCITIPAESLDRGARRLIVGPGRADIAHDCKWMHETGLLELQNGYEMTEEIKSHVLHCIKYLEINNKINEIRHGGVVAPASFSKSSYERKAQIERISHQLRTLTDAGMDVEKILEKVHDPETVAFLRQMHGEQRSVTTPVTRRVMAPASVCQHPDAYRRRTHEFRGFTCSLCGSRVRVKNNE